VSRHRLPIHDGEEDIRASIDTGRILGTNAGFRDHKGHAPTPGQKALSIKTILTTWSAPGTSHPTRGDRGPGAKVIMCGDVAHLDRGPGAKVIMCGDVAHLGVSGETWPASPALSHQKGDRGPVSAWTGRQVRRANAAIHHCLNGLATSRTAPVPGPHPAHSPAQTAPAGSRHARGTAHP